MSTRLVRVIYRCLLHVLNYYNNLLLGNEQDVFLIFKQCKMSQMSLIQPFLSLDTSKKKPAYCVILQ